VALVLGQLELGTLLLSPMAGVTNRVFRRLCRRMGADTVYTEFISGDGLIRGSETTLEMLQFSSEEHPIGIQLFGSDPEVLADAARQVAATGPDIIDINFGCPVRKVVRKEAGAAILRDLGLFREIVQGVVEAAGIPVTIKMRAGWDEGSLVYVEAAGIAAEAGAQAVTLHPRTRIQGYAGTADWSRIARLVRESPIPVIGNGDIFTPDDARRMLAETGCAAVMIARGAIGNPWIFSRTRSLLDSGEPGPEPDAAERLNTALLHARLDIEEKGEGGAVREMRRHLSNYTKGLWKGTVLRRAAVQIESYAAMEALIHYYLEALARHERGEGVTFDPLAPEWEGMPRA
jgi:tRNA-dihydrouridine synthase B